MARYVLRVRRRFEAAHHLTSYCGEPEPSHGHSWQVEAELTAERLDEEGMAVDFVAVSAALGELVRPLDHRDINSVPPFDELSPTAERLAAWFLDGLRRLLPAATVHAVTVWEGADCAATCVAESDPGA